MSLNVKNVASFSHHEQRETCATRPRYRQGRKDTAVKVYTINMESRYLLVLGVPSVGAKDELEKKCSEFGDLVHFYVLDEYPCEDFTEVYLVCFSKLQSARVAKRKLDTRSFFGGILHVCFAPEYETVDETRNKLIERQRYVAYVTGKSDSGPFEVRKSLKRNSDVTSDRLTLAAPEATSGTEMTYIWAGKTYTMPQQPVSEPTVESAFTSKDDTMAAAGRSKMPQFVPRQIRTSSSSSVKAKKEEEGDSLQSTSLIGRKVASLNVPNPIVSFKKRKT